MPHACAASGLRAGARIALGITLCRPWVSLFAPISACLEDVSALAGLLCYVRRCLTLLVPVRCAIVAQRLPTGISGVKHITSWTRRAVESYQRCLVRLEEPGRL